MPVSQDLPVISTQLTMTRVNPAYPIYVSQQQVVETLTSVTSLTQETGEPISLHADKRVLLKGDTFTVMVDGAGSHDFYLLILNASTTTSLLSSQDYPAIETGAGVNTSASAQQEIRYAFRNWYMAQGAIEPLTAADGTMAIVSTDSQGRRNVTVTTSQTTKDYSFWFLLAEKPNSSDPWISKVTDMPVTIRNTLPPVVGPNETQITSTTTGKGDFAVKGNRVIWTDKRSGYTEIYLLNRTTGIESRITNSSSEKSYLILTDNIIFWQDNREGSPAIYGFNPNTQSEFHVQTGMFPYKNKDRLVYARFGNTSQQVYLYNLTTLQETSISSRQFSYAYEPKLFGDTVVWFEYNASVCNFYAYNMTTGIERLLPITMPSWSWSYSLNGEQLAYITDNQVYIYSLSSDTNTPVSSIGSPKFSPCFLNDTIAWVDMRNGQPDIYMVNLSLSREEVICLDHATQNEPVISGNEVFWLDFRFGKPEILSWQMGRDISSPIANFTANITAGTAPLTVRFTDTSTGSPNGWNWSFGDGSFSNLQYPTHTYSMAGLFTVALTVTNSSSSNTLTKTNYITVNPSNPRTPDIVWQKCLGGLRNETISTIVPCSGGGYLLVGSTTSQDTNITDNHGGTDIIVIKVSSSGTIEWQKCYGGSGEDSDSSWSWDETSRSAQETTDGGFILIGYTNSINGDVTQNRGGTDVWVVKINVTGGIQWQKTYGGSSDDWGNGILQTSDGGYIFIGGTESTDGNVQGNHGSCDIWVVKLSSSGTPEWQKCLGGTDWDRGESIIETAGPAYTLTGYVYSYNGDVIGNHGNDDLWVARINATGFLEWQRCFGGLLFDWGTDIRKTTDGGVIVVGGTGSHDGNVTDNHGSVDMFVVKLNQSGALEWQRCYGSDLEEWSTGVSQNRDGYYLLVGEMGPVVSAEADSQSAENNPANPPQRKYPTRAGKATGLDETISTKIVLSASPGPQSVNVFLVNLAGNGSEDWQKIIGGSSDDLGSGGVQADDGGYYVIGKTESNDGDVSGNHGGFDQWLVKLSSANGPIAAFTATPLSGTAPLTVNFTDTSTGSPNGWAWFFGDETYNAPWTQVNASAGWSARDWHSSVAMPDGSIVLMGGWDGNNKNDVWRSTDNGATWVQVNASAGWVARHAHSSVTMSDGSIVLTGGYSGGSGKNDTWKSTDNGATWTQMTASAGWVARGYHSSVAALDGSIVLTGGLDSDGNRKNDTWKSTDNGATWTQVNASAGWVGRSHHSSIVMPDGSIVLTGGYDGVNNYNDTWRSADNGVTWTVVSATAGWTSRAGHSSVVMPDGSVVLIGGNSNGTAKNDVWRSTNTGATWTLVNASAGWAARAYHSSTAMPDGSIVLMGGGNSDGFKNDTWRFVPTGSSEQNPSHTFTAAGNYTASLTVVNQNGFNTLIKTGYISVTGSTTDRARLILPAASLYQNTATQIPIGVMNITGGTGISFNLTYNPSVIQVNEITLNQSYASGSSLTVNATPGLIRISLTRTESINIGSPVPVFFVNTTGIGTTGSSTPLTVSSATWSDGTFNNRQFDTVNGTVLVYRIRGDLNGNGWVDIGDTAKTAYMVVGLTPDLIPDADFNNNGRIDVGDATKIAGYLVGKITEL
ncbi:MAG: kelch repeat-containing protein [Methanoregula sp.]|jgi:beta propeller repeat protein